MTEIQQTNIGVVNFIAERLKQAIADVESCMEVSSESN